MLCEKPVGRYRVLSDHVMTEKAFRINKCIPIGKFQWPWHDIN